MKKNTTKRSLILSAVSLLLCVSMLIGTTFAWFTDSVTSGSNIIKSGNLDIVLEYWDGTAWVDANGKVIPFVTADNRAQDQILWEPGCTYEMAPFRVRSEGNLSSKFLILLNGITGDEKLMEAITLKTRVNNIPDSLLNGSAGNVFQRFEDAEVDIFYGVPEGNVVFDGSLAGKGQITPGTGHTDTSPEFTIFGHMAEEAGNEYQGLSLEGISITVIATQETYESDSFNKYYDKLATLPKTESAEVTDTTAATTITVDNVSVTVPAGVPAGTYTVQVSNENESVDANGVTTYNFDVDLLKNGVKVQADGVTSYLVKVNIGADKVISKLLHKGEEITAFDYNSTTGILEFTTLSFSPFTVIFEESKVVKVGSADELTALLAEVTEPVAIDATGVTLYPTGSLDTTVRIPAGVTLIGADFSASSQCYLVTYGVGEDVVFEECTFDGPGFGMFVIAGNDANGANMVFENCVFKGQIAPNFYNNAAGTATFNNCKFTVGSENIGLVNCMGGAHTFNSCTFDYTGGATHGSNKYVKWNAVNSYSESYSTSVVLNGCTRINCGTQRFGSNSTLTVK